MSGDARSVGGVFQTDAQYTETSGGGFTNALLTTPTITGAYPQAVLPANAVAGGALSVWNIGPKQLTAVLDDTATTLFTVTVPNPATFHTAVIDLTVVGICGAGGAVAAGESCSAAFYQIVVTRTAGVAGVTGISTAASATAASSAVSGGDQVVSPLLVTCGAIAGGATVSETFTIQVTVDDDTGSGTNHVVIGYASLLNVNSSGVTIV